MNVKKLAACLIAQMAVLSLVAETAEDLWDVYGDFGKAEGGVTRTASGFSFAGAGSRVETVVATGVCGVVSRRTRLTNVSERPLAARCLLDRFLFDGGDWEVYTQANTWQNESRGLWQPLNTGVEVRGAGMCSARGAAPVLALWNPQAGRGTVFHLLADSGWEMHALREAADGQATRVAVEVGVDSRHLNHMLAPGESVALPEVVFYEFANRLDLDCHRLHAYWNDRQPAHQFASAYNTWMARFDRFDADFVLRQVPVAAEIGLDYFVIDAGWFGSKGSWWFLRGDWEERPDGALAGRLAEISSAVRAAGMKFGIWIEAESAHPDSRIVREHPDWFVRREGLAFIDFANPEAVRRLTETTCRLLERYEATFIKQDFNQSTAYDPTGRAFADYHRHFADYLAELRRRIPGLYIEGCAGGGLRTDLGRARLFDGFWPSDNESPYEGLRIARETMLRLPPRLIERWLVACSLKTGQIDYNGKDERLGACDDATWSHIRTVDRDLLRGFAAGGPVCLSCDLTAFSAADRAFLKGLVAETKRSSDFWRTAVGRILFDTPAAFALQYSDESLSDIRVTVVANRTRQARVTVRPVVADEATYLCDGREISSAELRTRGLELPVPANHGAVAIHLRRKGYVALGGHYAGHLQDVWRDGTNIWWAHTQELVRTDLDGRIIRRAKVGGHHAGLEVCDGRLYTAVCAVNGEPRERTTPDCHVMVGEYDAETLERREMHVLDINDRAGSFCRLADGTYLIGCLRHPSLKPTEVKFHHVDRDFKLIKTHVVDVGRPVPMGIEVIRRDGDDLYLFIYYGPVMKLDAKTFEVKGRYRDFGGQMGFSPDGESAWVGETTYDEASRTYSSGLKKVPVAWQN